MVSLRGYRPAAIQQGRPIAESGACLRNAVARSVARPRSHLRCAQALRDADRDTRDGAIDEAMMAEIKRCRAITLNLGCRHAMTEQTRHLQGFPSVAATGVVMNKTEAMQVGQQLFVRYITGSRSSRGVGEKPTLECFSAALRAGSRHGRRAVVVGRSSSRGQDKAPNCREVAKGKKFRHERHARPARADAEHGGIAGLMDKLKAGPLPEASKPVPARTCRGCWRS